MVKELEELKCQSLEKLKSEKLPSNCSQWIKTTSKSSCDFVVLFSSDFRPKLAKELADIEQEQRDAIKCLKEAQDNVKQFSDIILENLKELLIYFKRGKSTPNATSKDPWMSELTIRHFSAKFLDKKSEYLVTLYRVFTQIRHLHTELNHKLAVYSDEFLRIMERFGLAQVDEKPSQLDFGSLNLSATPNGTASFDSILKNYSLNYEWKLNCPPLDGFLSTLYNHLKSLGADFTIETGNVPKIFSENSLRFGFLQKLISGILTRNWQVNFAILQPSTGFLHLYKVNREKGSRTTDGENNNVTVPSGHLLVPSAVNSYTKSSLHDLNVLATQFHLQSPHHPAAISPQTLTPFLSIPIGPNCKIMATDPITFTFSIKLTGGEKFYFKAFCEEEFVDWVIFLNETVKKTSGVTKSAVEKEKSSEKNSPTLSEEAANSSSSASSSSSSPPTNTQMNQITATTTFSSMAPIADLENPWE